MAPNIHKVWTSVPCRTANTRFHAHARRGGEVILVLDDVFRAEFGADPAGSRLRRPRCSRHAPLTGPEDALVQVKPGHPGAALDA